MEGPRPSIANKSPIRLTDVFAPRHRVSSTRNSKLTMFLWLLMLFTVVYWIYWCAWDDDAHETAKVVEDRQKKIDRRRLTLKPCSGLNNLMAIPSNFEDKSLRTAETTCGSNYCEQREAILLFELSCSF